MSVIINGQRYETYDATKVVMHLTCAGVPITINRVARQRGFFVSPLIRCLVFFRNLTRRF